MNVLLLAFALASARAQLAEPFEVPEELSASVAETAGSVGSTGCFERHIREALALNRERKPLYSAASGGASERVSRRLIDLETLSLFAAKWFDWRAGKWRKNGVPLLCDEFEPMSAAPAFATGTIPPPRRPLVWDPRVKGRELSRLHCDSPDGCLALEQALDQQLADLAHQPDYFCMTRHLLESARRAARLAPVHDAASSAKNLDSPFNISRGFIGTQLAVLSEAWELDEWAAPIQAAGVPILCADVPPIP